MSATTNSSPVERGSLLVGGTRTRLVQAGPAETGEAVVFLHGNPGSSDDWVGLAAVAASAGRRAVAFDLPDFGETIAPDGFQHDVPGYAGFVEAALTKLGIERVHLVLHDFGGPIGLYWAASHPDALAGITLIDTGLLPGYKWHTLARVWRTPIVGEIFQATATRPAFRYLLNRNEPRGLPRDFVEAMYDHFDRRTRKAVLELYRATDDPGGMSEALVGLFADREIPALVIWGEHDAYLPWKYAERQRDAFPAAEVHVLPASGHFPFADAPETVERLFAEFLAALPAPASDT
ncbi:MAG TPA: alpha/beta hydrolase, partial [Solirubrobacterales bacterium]|nr:alpha/beta hydrolase [Solirubrobacterales bacterium]